jgi:NADH-quinone oxidoreductase subunit L
MVLTFLGVYRGPAWSPFASPAAASEAAAHGARHPRDAPAHGQAEREAHEVTHGPASRPPNPEPRVMTIPLMALAAGAILAGFIGIPAVLGGADALGAFLRPSFEAPAGAASFAPAETAGHLARGAELAVVLVSVLVAVVGILAARYLYLARPELPRALARRWRGVHALLSNQFYVNELYDATIVRGTLAGARHLRTFDRRVVDAAVDGVGMLTQLGSWASHMIDKHLVDGIVNGLARGAGQASFFIRLLQSGLVQTYALLMVLGLFAFLTLYLLGG